jgi:hypothetical protein
MQDVHVIIAILLNMTLFYFYILNDASDEPATIHFSIDPDGL